MASESTDPPPMPSSANGNDPTKTGYDPTRKWTNYFNIIMGRMTPEGQFNFREDAYTRNEERDIKRCEEWRDWCFNYSPTVIFMKQNIESLNGNLNSTNVRCRRCFPVKGPDGKWSRRGGGFHPDYGIEICSNEIRDKKHMEDTLAHEMVHAWDHLRFKIDYGDLRHAACMEIRAASLSGECRWTREFFTRGSRKLTQQHQNCVRKRAILSLLARPFCKDDVQAAKAVNEVWDSCFADTRPFDSIYR